MQAWAATLVLGEADENANCIVGEPTVLVVVYVDRRAAFDPP